MSNAPELSAAERKRFRGKAMNLKPVVIVGRAGPSETVIKAVNEALDRDKLIKIRLEAPDRKTRQAWLDQIAESTRSTICGTVGHTASLYREKSSSAN